jgi:cell wall assembly regulator SMI1
VDANDLARRFQEILAANAPPVVPIVESVARLDAWLARHRPDYYATLLPGLTDAEWVDFELAIGVRLPESFRVLYQWRNGSPDGSERFRGNWEWMSAESVLSSKLLHDGMIGFDFEEGWWEREWVPFMANGGGSHLCVDAGGVPDGKPGQLREFWKADPDRPVVAVRLDVWLNDFVVSLEGDRWAITDGGFFVCVERRDDE